MKRYCLFLSTILVIFSLFIVSCSNALSNFSGNSISFTLPQVCESGSARGSVTLENGSYYKVVCTETKNNKVIYDEEVSPGDTVNIQGVAAGDYEISVNLFQPDNWSMFQNSIVLTSSATAGCTVHSGEAAQVEIKLPSPMFVGLDIQCMPCIGKDDYLLECQVEVNPESNEVYRSYSLAHFSEKDLNDKNVKFTFKCGNQSAVYESNFYINDYLDIDNLYAVVIEPSEDLMEILNGYTPFEIKIEYDDVSYTLPVTKAYIDLIKNQEKQEWVGEVMATQTSLLCNVDDNIYLYITKVFPYRVYYQFDKITVTGYDAEKDYYFDYFTIGNKAHQYNEKLCFMYNGYYDEGAGIKINTEYIGSTFQTFEELKNALSDVFEQETTIKLSGPYGKEEVKINPENALNINRWLNGEQLQEAPEPEDPEGGSDPDPFAGYTAISSYGDFPYAATLSGNYYLTKDIYINSPWANSITLNGIFDGNGHTITFIGQDSGCYPLFNEITEGSVVKNLTLAGELRFAADLTRVAPFGKNNGYIIACSIAGISMKTNNTNPESVQYNSLFINGNGKAVGCIIDDNAKTSEDNYIGCYNKDNPQADLESVNTAIANYNNGTEVTYQCNYHFVDNGGTVTLEKD